MSRFSQEASGAQKQKLWTSRRGSNACQEGVSREGFLEKASLKGKQDSESQTAACDALHPHFCSSLRCWFNCPSYERLFDPSSFPIRPLGSLLARCSPMSNIYLTFLSLLNSSSGEQGPCPCCLHHLPSAQDVPGTEAGAQNNAEMLAQGKKNE